MNPELKTKVLLGSDDLILRTKLKSECYWKTNFNLEEFGPLRGIDMNRKWPNLEEERVFSPPKGRVRSKKHQLTPSPDDSRNVRQKKDNKSSDEESDDDSHITEEL